MTWKGFIKESKSYVGYKTKQDKIKFWKRFPRAWIIFYSRCFYDKFLIKLKRRIL